VVPVVLVVVSLYHFWYNATSKNLWIYIYIYCDLFGRMPSLLGNLKLDTHVIVRQPKVKNLHGYARQSVLSRCMVA
jgi:hypothetical protein